MPRTLRPNRILGIDIEILATDPLLGVLELETDEGHVDLVINRSCAEILKAFLTAFLEESEDE